LKSRKQKEEGKKEENTGTPLPSACCRLPSVLVISQTCG
jgi:hypothetical protein